VLLELSNKEGDISMAKRNMVQYNLVKNSIAAYFAAIEIHNKPSIAYRYETVTLLMINAWELIVRNFKADVSRCRGRCRAVNLSSDAIIGDAVRQRKAERRTPVKCAQEVVDA